MVLLNLAYFVDRACAKGGNTKHALTLFQVVKDKGLPLDAYIYTTVIDGE